MMVLNYRQSPSSAGLVTISGGIYPLVPVFETQFNPYPDTIPPPTDV